MVPVEALILLQSCVIMVGGRVVSYLNNDECQPIPGSYLALSRDLDPKHDVAD